MKLRMPWGNLEQAGAASGGKRADGAGQGRTSSSSMAMLNRQIRSFVPGQTLRGEIISRNGSDVQIKLSDDMVLQAKVDQNMNLEVGKSMTFEVRNNGSMLTLSPLFENMSADVNVLKALDMASLPVNETTVSMTRQLMEAGLPVDKNSLQKIYRQTASFPQAEISDIVGLHKLGMEVNETNINQMISYRNMTHQLSAGADTVLAALTDTVDGMAAAGDDQGLYTLYRELLELVMEVSDRTASDAPSMQDIYGADAEGAGVPAEGNASFESPAGAVIEGVPEDGAVFAGASADGAAAGANADGAAIMGALADGASAGVSADGAALMGTLADGASLNGALAGGSSLSGANAEGMVPAGENAGGAVSGIFTDSAVSAESPADGAAAAEEILQSAGTNGGEAGEITGQLMEILGDLPMEPMEKEQISRQLIQYAWGNLSRADFFAAAARMLQAADTVDGGVKNMHRVFSGSAFRELLNRSLKQLWSIQPEETAQKQKVEELYQRLDRQLKSLSHVLENAGQGESGAFRAVSSMTQNIDFLNQLNQMYAYVQLPLRLRQGDANGELYVYTNKKSLAAFDGKISALLHLDMEHLGPVDVYVTLEQARVNTRFYVRDDEMLDFLEAHMHILTKRLAERGYDCSFSMTSRKDEKTDTKNSGLLPLLEQEKGMMVTQYAFDVRT